MQDFYKKLGLLITFHLLKITHMTDFEKYLFFDELFYYAKKKVIFLYENSL